MTPEFADQTAAQHARRIWLTRQEVPPEAGEHAASWAMSSDFSGKSGQVCLLPDGQGKLAGAVIGLGPADTQRRPRFALADSFAALPEGAWRIANWPDGVDRSELAFSCLLAQYNFSRYHATTPTKARLVAPDGVDAACLIAMAGAEFLTRDLINTPASDMGPDALEQAARDLAKRCDMQMNVISGETLEKQFPMIHAVGRAAAQAPRLIELTCASSEAGATPCPTLTLVGKGVCFDTGGLNIKPSSSMGLMKKDMGGAATALGLAQMLINTGAARGLRLRVLIPAVENAISASSFRPGDILTSRKGLTVEINNTDAEGRLVLADALAYAAEDKPDWLISIATLTGAARVALGPDIPPFYCDDDAAAGAIFQAGQQAWDPLWRMPFWSPYEDMIEPGIADLDNAPGGGMAGSITAALFLRRFAQGAARYAHLDIYGWQPKAAPGRTKGGVGQGARALLTALPRLIGTR